ncbi:hypothetical protein C0989_009522 [Termitomyces sp. Mn162]|nr:hypothetical protein C0989_009522 [Termitomyces sp. Mn162]
MSASARAEARRKAILSRGSDRLAKLTTSARGDDPAYIHPDSPSTIRKASSNFLGEETTMPPPPNLTSSSRCPQNDPESVNVNPFTGSAPDPSVWSEQQQQQLLQALMGGTRPPEPVPGLTPTDMDSSLPPPLDNPLAAMLFPRGQGAFPQFSPAGAGGKASAASAPPPPTRLQKLMPFVHLLSMWALLTYFVVYMEPRVWIESVGNLVDVGGQRVGIWSRWAELGRSRKLEDVALMMRDTVQPPTLLAIVLPHLPPPLPSIIVNGLKYFQMGSLFLDDLAGLLVGIGFIVMFSGWFATSS